MLSHPSPGVLVLLLWIQAGAAATKRLPSSDRGHSGSSSATVPIALPCCSQGQGGSNRTNTG